MADGNGEPGKGAAGGGILSKQHLVSGGVGALLGAAATFIVNIFTAVGLKDLLDSDPYVGLAVLAILAALVTFVLGLAVLKDTIKVVSVISGVMVAAAALFTGLSFMPPQLLPITLRASPDMGSVPPVEVIGKDLTNLAWMKDVAYKARRRDAININAQPIKDYYSTQLAHCVQTISDTSSGKVHVDLSQAAY